jgi:site-specific DNA recombinase
MMEVTNGQVSKWAVLYARVSTDEQAKSGYSLAQQLEALREYAVREGIEILEEIMDPGQSGASLERPGMDRVRDLVAAGGVDTVFAQDRDRFTREPAYHYLLKREFEEQGTKLCALNDHGDDSPEGELTDGILDQLAKYERAKTAERTRRGKLRKAREGKIVAARPRPTYGFAYNDRRDGYVIDDEAMAVVRRIFEMCASGMSIRSVKTALDAEGVPTPNGGRHWSRMTIRDIVLDDCYKPHSYEEVGKLVAPEVASKLDPRAHYGISWYGRTRSTTKQVVERDADGQRHYRRRKKATQRPREEWLAVPIPANGIPRELVEAARAAIKDNVVSSSAGERFWELSAGVLVCGECGKRMRADRKRRKGLTSEKFHHYYRCPTRQTEGKDACANSKNHRAEEIEGTVWEFVSGLLKDPEQLRADLNAMIELQRHDLRGDPEREAKAWLEKLAEVDRKRSGYIDLAADEIIDRDELRTKLAALEETRETARRELDALSRRREEIEKLEHDRDALLDSLEAAAPDVLDALAPEERHHVYNMLRLRVLAHPDGALEPSGTLVCIIETTSMSHSNPRGHTRDTP